MGECRQAVAASQCLEHHSTLSLIPVSREAKEVKVIDGLVGGEERGSLLSKEHAHIANLYYNQAVFYKELQDYDSAEKNLRKSVNCNK